ncbi:sulfite exporter TauE/SafE family protein [Ferriphaselus sp. R-1]|uniref:sulfite exporter TauE/SafE family protein n=1 Tax=Ferriphaselus sp. R-1 TaxID=1485544 RepID=UPI000557E82B|nr:sulfite exporter TauE/SafE family protein [Ferriphaselus sp. R-1]
MDWLYTFSGLLVGLIVGVSGVGGGSLMTPLLVLLFGISPATAVGTDLLYAALTKLGGSWVHHKKGSVDWQIVKRLATGSIPAALLSLWALHELNLDEKQFKSIITTVLSVALSLTALSLFLKPQLQKLGRRKSEANVELHAHPVAATVITGAILGVLVTISSVGAGALGMGVLLFLYPRHATVKLVGSDIAHAVPLTLVAGLGHAALGTVNFSLLGALLLGSLPGIWIGSHLSARIPERVLQLILATLLLTIAAKFLFLK